jgi:hypothetical protein
MLDDAAAGDPSPRRVEVLARWFEHRNRRALGTHDRAGGVQFLAAEMIAYAIQSVGAGRRAKGNKGGRKAEDHRGARRCDGRAALAWLSSRTSPEGITFVDCCELLRVAVEILRQRVFRELNLP